MNSLPIPLLEKTKAMNGTIQTAEEDSIEQAVALSDNLMPVEVRVLE